MNVITGDHKPIKVWCDDVEDKALQQLKNTASLPFLFKHLAVMPDVHFGKGATIGSVVVTKHAIVPAAVGVDIGCGMLAARTSLTADDLPDSLTPLRLAIEESVPVGFCEHGDLEAADILRDNETWLDLHITLGQIQRKHPGIKQSSEGKAFRQLGTLGGGNHFIELCLDEKNRVWVMLHSGSRNIGNVIAQYFIERAKQHMVRWHVPLVDKDLAFLPEGVPDFEDYWWALQWAQNYALLNRDIILNLVLGTARELLPEFTVEGTIISCHHNYAVREHHYGENVIVTRKGAVRAREDDLGIVPGSIGSRSFIVEGKGNPMSFHSCSHGAGRKMGRGQANRTFTVADMEKAQRGIECDIHEGVLDEHRDAYKNIDQVMAAQKDLVTPRHELRQVLVVKG